MKMQQVIGVATAAALALVVVGCGGGGGSSGGTDSSTAAPAAVMPAGIASALAYIAEQKILPSDVVDPQGLRQMLPPANDTIEPAPI